MTPPASTPSENKPPARVSIADVTALLHLEIPLTRAMGFSISEWDGRTVTLAAPLANNQNHADTAFGGSISSMGILAGYSLLYLLLREQSLSTRILIQKSSTTFTRPVDTDIVATACRPPADALAEFFELLRRKRKARLELESKILSGKTLAATHIGLYVAMIY
jgi:thioesterase domain-containing protein